MNSSRVALPLVEIMEIDLLEGGVIRKRGRCDVEMRVASRSIIVPRTIERERD
jgi:hypothetical protein